MDSAPIMTSTFTYTYCGKHDTSHNAFHENFADVCVVVGRADEGPTQWPPNPRIMKRPWNDRRLERNLDT